MGTTYSVKFLLQRNSLAQKGGNVDQDIRGRGLVLGKVTSLKDLMIFYLEELLRPTEVRAILGSRNSEEGEDCGGFTAVCRTNNNGGKPQGEDFISALGRRAPGCEGVSFEALAGL